MAYIPFTWVEKVSKVGPTNLNHLELGLQAAALVADNALPTPAYTAYTPIWASSGTQPALGNGSLVGRYVRIGKFVHFTISLQPGSTTTFGTGTYTFSLPVTAVGNTAGAMALGTCWSQQNSSAFWNAAQLTLAGGSVTVATIQYPTTYPTSAATVYGATAPWAWATSDRLNASGVYEAA